MPAVDAIAAEAGWLAGDDPVFGGVVGTVEDRRDGCPDHLGDFVVGPECRGLGELEHVRRDQHIQYAAARCGTLLIQGADVLSGDAEIEANFLLGLAYRGVQQRTVVGFPMAAGKRHVPGPGVAGLFRTSYEQYVRCVRPRWRAPAQDDRNSRLARVRSNVVLEGIVLLEARTDVLEAGSHPLSKYRSSTHHTKRSLNDHRMRASMDLESVANRCFVCGPGNARGLKVAFRLDDDDVCRAEFTPGPQFMGYDGVTHGGILFCLLDDVMANYMFLKGIPCFTAKAEVRYRAQLPVNVPIALEGRLLKRKGRLAVIEGKALRQDTGELVTESTASFMVQA